MMTIKEIFDAMGGPANFARVMDLKPSAASEMKRRKSIPVQYWPQLIRALRAAKKPVTYDQLVEIKRVEDEARKAERDGVAA